MFGRENQVLARRLPHYFHQNYSLKGTANSLLLTIASQREAAFCSTAGPTDQGRSLHLRSSTLGPQASSSPTGHTLVALSEEELMQLWSFQGCGPKARKRAEAGHRAGAPWKPAQIPPPPPQVPGEPQGCVPKPCPEAAALGSHQPDPELGALQDLPNKQGNTSTTLPLPPTAQKPLIHN